MIAFDYTKYLLVTRRDAHLSAPDPSAFLLPSDLPLEKFRVLDHRRDHRTTFIGSVAKPRYEDRDRGPFSIGIKSLRYHGTRSSALLRSRFNFEVYEELIFQRGSFLQSAAGFFQSDTNLRETRHACKVNVFVRLANRYIRGHFFDSKKERKFISAGSLCSSKAPLKRQQLLRDAIRV